MVMTITTHLQAMTMVVTMKEKVEVMMPTVIKVVVVTLKVTTAGSTMTVQQTAPTMAIIKMAVMTTVIFSHLT